ncbi:MAG TPA: zinc ribbon domain-containing protein [Gammaproteobacteria bacterium]|nr:zinc ribbon domain-containing protein [Gammaproteobacteria bacterium]
MPIYEYECQACGHQFEALQKVSDAPLKKCPECGKPKLRKLMSAPSFRLKGGGWYETDFKSGQKRNLADGGKEDKPAAKGDSAEPTSAKPAKGSAVEPASAAKPKPADKKPKGGEKSKPADT